jgi:hypothetical protein
LVIVLAAKLASMVSAEGTLRPLVANSPFFYISLTGMILGTQLFLTGFIGELIVRNSSQRNTYTIDREL